MDYLEEGKKTERMFAQCLVETLGGDTLVSTDEEDINSHIDLYWVPPRGCRCSFDIKGLRKDARDDEQHSSEHTWVEFKNVNGNRGSLYGQQDYIAFETDNQWLIVRRKEFAKACKNKVKDGNVSHSRPDEDFVLYQRNGRKDVIMRIPLSFVRENCCKILEKR